VLAKSFDHTVGGKYFDECLVNHFTEEFKVLASTIFCHVFDGFILVW